MVKRKKLILEKHKKTELFLARFKSNIDPIVKTHRREALQCVSTKCGLQIILLLRIQRLPHCLLERQLVVVEHHLELVLLERTLLQ